ncbi:hypothetical protein GCM10010320_76040 [Streptomyces caelestis]|nr:hypothetical protein GCM10010320_76040 [Streptomyces caelestis]
MGRSGGRCSRTSGPIWPEGAGRPGTHLLRGPVPPRPNAPAPTGWHQTLSAVRKVVAIMSMAVFPAGTGPVWVK